MLRIELGSSVGAIRSEVRIGWTGARILVKAHSYAPVAIVIKIAKIHKNVQLDG